MKLRFFKKTETRGHYDSIDGNYFLRPIRRGVWKITHGKKTVGIWTGSIKDALEWAEAFVRGETEKAA